MVGESPRTRLAERLSSVLGRIADGYTLIRYDRLGAGMSDRTLHDADLTLDREVATLRSLVDD